MFRSIQDNVSESDGSGTSLLPWLCAGGGFVLVLIFFSRRQARIEKPRPVRNHAKLMKEIMKSVPLKSAELKQLKVVAQETVRPDGNPISSPLALVLCPSTLARVVQTRSTRADRQVLLRVLRKIR